LPGDILLEFRITKTIYSKGVSLPGDIPIATHTLEGIAKEYPRQGTS